VNEKKEILNMLKEMWQKGNSPLRRIYSSWEELEANVEIKTEKATQKHMLQPCPNCGAKQKITKPLEDFFPYQKCTVCNQPFYVNQDLTVRKLTGEEKDMPQAWVQIVEDINKKKLAVAFKLE
jgi:DNA replication initiation complex subunit (GINS family)